ncbi:hypothetical protein TNCV_3083481 [Trichonephila clavipes]|nr:hypothetical protein TNCV_3083481 [Trichonephila clavipes]
MYHKSISLKTREGKDSEARDGLTFLFLSVFRPDSPLPPFLEQGRGVVGGAGKQLLVEELDRGPKPRGSRCFCNDKSTTPSGEIFELSFLTALRSKK